MKIWSMQAGGVAYIPSVGQPVAQSTSTSSAKTETNKLQTELVSLIKEKGLPNDVDKFLSQINNVLGMSLDGEFSTSTLISAASLANRVNHYAELHKTAQKRLDDEDAGSEVAMTANGELYVLSKKGLETVSANEFSQHRDKYQALSNNDLLTLRQENESLAFNGSILNNLAKTTSLKSVSDYVVKLINDFGEYKNKSESSPYSNIQMNKISDGLRQMIGDGPDGYYKLNQSTSKSDQGYSNEDSFQAAVDYLYNALPKEMKSVLKAHTAVEGRDPSKKEDVQFLLMQAVSQHTDHSIETSFKPDYEGVMVSGGSGKGTGSSKTEEVSYAESFQYGRDIPVSNFLITQNTLSADGRSALSVPGQTYTLLDTKGETLPQSNLKVALDKFAGTPSLDRSNVYFGDIKVTEKDFNKVVLSGDGQVHRVLLPYDKIAAATSGEIKPDLAALDKYNQLKKWIAENPGIAPNLVISKAREMGLDLETDGREGFKLSEASCKVFAAIGGMVSSDDTGLNFKPGSSKFMSEADQLADIYNHYTNYTGETTTKSSKIPGGANHPTGWLPGQHGRLPWNANEHIYQGQIFIPIREGADSSVHLGKTIVDQSTYYNLGARFASQQKYNNIQAHF